MLVSRWQAPILPTRQQMMLMLESEGLDPQELYAQNNELSKSGDFNKQWNREMVHQYPRSNIVKSSTIAPWI